MSSAPPQCPLHCPQHPALPFSRICNPIPQEGHPALAQLHFLPLVTPLKSIVPMKFGSKEAESPPMGARLPSAPAMATPQGARPILRPSQEPASIKGRSCVGTDIRNQRPVEINASKDPVATSRRLQDHITQGLTGISPISRWKTQKQGKNCHFRGGQRKLESEHRS